MTLPQTPSKWPCVRDVVALLSQELGIIYPETMLMTVTNLHCAAAVAAVARRRLFIILHKSETDSVDSAAAYFHETEFA